MSVYPTSYHLQRIREWDAACDPEGVMKFVCALWHGGGRAAFDGTRLDLHTGGSPANEELVSELQANETFWLLYWEESRRGGHYAFEIACEPRRSTAEVDGEEEEACSTASDSFEGSRLQPRSAG